jgi:regulation of enolase protein 1 (concanavalin A-like superfamily)
MHWTIGLTVTFLVFAQTPLLTAPRAVGAGFITVKERDGRWWFLDPEGNPFISKGVCHITFRGDAIQGTDRSPYREAVSAKYGEAGWWREAVAGRLLGWGFNSLGAWSDNELRRVEHGARRLVDSPILDLGAGFVGHQRQGAQAWLQGLFPDVFDAGFETYCLARARERCAPLKDDPTILGWFTDNELRWGPDWRGNDELLTLFLNLPVAAPGRVAAMRLLRERHTEIERFNQAWHTQFASWADLDRAERVEAPYTRKAVYAQNEGEERQLNEADPRRAAFVADCEAFLEQVAERYFRITGEAVRAADPNHLNFGSRFAYVPPAPVRAAAARHLDVISFNCYQTDPTETVRRYAALGRPMIIGEFTFRAADAGLPNTKGAGPRVATQVERADAFEHYVRLLLREPGVVGYHWFQHNDQPKEGRFDGEDSNYGVVDGRDEVYFELTRRMTEVNRQAEAWHRGLTDATFHDTFRGRLGEGWRWVREDPDGWRMTDHGLEIRVQPGNMWGGANDARNVLVRDVPDPEHQTVNVSVSLANRPTAQYEQVDLVWYYDDRHMVKIGQELVDGKLSVVMGREERDQCRTIAIHPIDGEVLEVRFIARDREIRGEYRIPGETEWRLGGVTDLPVNGSPKVSLQCYQGPADVEHWARLWDFRLY